MVTGALAACHVGLQVAHLEERRGLDTGFGESSGGAGSPAWEPGDWVEHDTTSACG